MIHVNRVSLLRQSQSEEYKQRTEELYLTYCDSSTANNDKAMACKLSLGMAGCARQQEDQR